MYDDHASPIDSPIGFTGWTISRSYDLLASDGLTRPIMFQWRKYRKYMHLSAQNVKTASSAPWRTNEARQSRLDTLHIPILLRYR